MFFFLLQSIANRRSIWTIANPAGLNEPLTKLIDASSSSPLAFHLQIYFRVQPVMAVRNCSISIKCTRTTRTLYTYAHAFPNIYFHAGKRSTVRTDTGERALAREHLLAILQKPIFWWNLYVSLRFVRACLSGQFRVEKLTFAAR